MPLKRLVAREASNNTGSEPNGKRNESRIFEVITTREPDYAPIADAETEADAMAGPHAQPFMRWLEEREGFAGRSSNSYSP